MSGFDPETSSTDQTLMNHGWNSMKSKMRGLSTLNWADGTKVWFSREVGKWIKKRIFPLHLLCVCAGLMTVPGVMWLIWTKKKKKNMSTWILCVSELWLLAVFVYQYCECVCVTWQLWGFSRLSVSGKFSFNAAKANSNVNYLHISKGRSRMQKCLGY